MTTFPSVWEFIERFKLKCHKKGWEVFENEDLVDVDGECHRFIWVRHVSPNTFKKVVTNPSVLVKKGASFRTVNVSYVAWISPESIAERILDSLLDAPGLLRKVAVYDVSPVYRGEPVCLKINNTESIVFQEFERFLDKEHMIRVEPIYEVLPSSKNI